VFVNNRDVGLFFLSFLYGGAFFYLKQSKDLICPLLQKHDLSGATELRGGLRGGHQPSDQHGAVCVLRLPFYGESPKPLQHPFPIWRKV
jgi:hypothetical protein